MNTEKKEGAVAKTIESQTAKIPSDVFPLVITLSYGSIPLPESLQAK